MKKMAEGGRRHFLYCAQCNCRGLQSPWRSSSQTNYQGKQDGRRGRVVPLYWGLLLRLLANSKSISFCIFVTMISHHQITRKIFYSGESRTENGSTMIYFHSMASLTLLSLVATHERSVKTKKISFRHFFVVQTKPPFSQFQEKDKRKRDHTCGVFVTCK